MFKLNSGLVSVRPVAFVAAVVMAILELDRPVISVASGGDVVFDCSELTLY